MKAGQSTTAAARKLPIRNGQVECPIRGITDIELCFYCDNLVSVDLDSVNPTVICKAADNISAKERKAYKWVSLLQLADRYGNVSKICRENGISRSMFYRYKRRYQKQGFSGLLDMSNRS